MPSVQLQDVPRQDLGEHLGLWQNDDQTSKDELDKKLARTPTSFLSLCWLLSLTSNLLSSSVEQAAYTYSLQDPASRPDAFEPSSSDPEPESDTSTYSSQRRRKQRVRQARKARAAAKPRMSIMSNSWYDVPPLDHSGFYDYGEDATLNVNGKRVNGVAEGHDVVNEKRKMLWDSGVRWDMVSGKVVVQEALDLRLSVGELMERGGVNNDGVDWEDNEDEGETESEEEEDDEAGRQEEEEEEETMDEDDG